MRYLDYGAGVAVSAFALLPCDALASPPTTDVPLAQALHGPAKDAYLSARLLFNNDDFLGAMTKYGLAYDLAKDPRLLYNMALCDKNLRRYARMRDLLVRYQREAGEKPTVEQKAAVDEALHAIENLVGSAEIATSPPGASVSVDGDVVGVTPLSDPLTLDLGKHPLLISKEGFDPVSKEINIVGADRQSFAVTLVAVKHAGHLSIRAESGATIAVDGKVVGTDRFEGQLPVGTYEVNVSEPGKSPERVQIELHDHETRTLEVTLSDEARASAPIWPWVVGGVALAAGAAVGGYFLFKPGDSTRAVPNGTLAGIQLSAWGGR